MCSVKRNVFLDQKIVFYKNIYFVYKQLNIYKLIFTIIILCCWKFNKIMDHFACNIHIILNYKTYFKALKGMLLLIFQAVYGNISLYALDKNNKINNNKYIKTKKLI